MKKFFFNNGQKETTVKNHGVEYAQLFEPRQRLVDTRYDYSLFFFLKKNDGFCFTE